MLARFTRLPLRRYLHTQPTRPQTSRLTWGALGVSAVTATYLTWRLLANPIAPDSHVTTSSLQKPNDSSKPPSKAAVVSPPSDSQTDRSSVPDSEPPPEHSSSTTLPEQELTNPSDKPDESGEERTEGEEGSSQGGGGAYNPETGEINWDCPCLGGMAHGPCGPEFREAFSCFVFSEEEPKGINCVEKFQAMQDCFRRHPEVYSDEIMDDDEEEAAAAAGTPEAAADADNADGAPSSTPETGSIPQETGTPPTVPS